MNQRAFKAMISLAMVIVVGICTACYFLLTGEYLTLRSEYAGYEAGYDEVILKPEYFCAITMKNTDDVKIDSELISNSKQYRFDTTKRKATTAGKDYSYEWQPRVLTYELFERYYDRYKPKQLGTIIVDKTISDTKALYCAIHGKRSLVIRDQSSNLI